MAEFTNKGSVFEQYRYKSGEFLQRIRRGLNAHTTLARIGARGQAVRLFYQQGAYVDIAPVFGWSGGGYALPSGEGGWLTTDPEAQASWFKSRVATLGVGLPWAVKLAKRWNRVHSNHFESYHLEVMVASMFSTISKNSRTALISFFEWGPQWTDVHDPAGHSGNLGAYLGLLARMAVGSRFQEALKRAQRALAAEGQGNHDEAKRLWQVELGTEFPTS